MTRLALCLLLLATGASADQLPPEIKVVSDHARGVTCWVFDAYQKGGISCIPDALLRAGSERQKSPHEQEDDGPTPAGADALWNEERYSL